MEVEFKAIDLEVIDESDFPRRSNVRGEFLIVGTVIRDENGQLTFGDDKRVFLIPGSEDKTKDEEEKEMLDRIMKFIEETKGEFTLEMQLERFIPIMLHELRRKQYKLSGDDSNVNDA